MTNQEIFNNYGCVKVKSFIDDDTISIISRYFDNKIKRGDWKEEDEGPNGSTQFFYYADPLVEIILDKVTPAVSESTGLELIPTYSYSRIYQPGEQLLPHVDRKACEISVTVSVSSEGPKSGIWMHYKNNLPMEMLLEPGDAVIYKGCESKHWRYPLQEGQKVVQFMLHYVDKNGPNAHLVFDRRQFLGAKDRRVGG